MPIKNINPLLLVVLTILFLLVFSILLTGYSVFGLNFKKVDLFSDIKIDTLKISYLSRLNAPIKIEDSLLFQDTLSGFNKSIQIIDSSVLKYGDLEDYSPEKHFFKSLSETKTKRIHIAYFGDSEIEGDLICKDFRELLQKEFGGSGVGYMHMVSIDAPFRMSVKHSFSDDWKSFSIVSNNNDIHDFGISGDVYLPSPDSWVFYESSNSKFDFKEIRLFCKSLSFNSQIKYSLDYSENKILSLKNERNIYEYKILPDKAAKNIKIFSPSDSMLLYGVSFENENGIYVDNFPLRGHSGIGLNRISKENLIDFSKFIDCKLIVLHFGMNVVGEGQTSFGWYVKRMVDVINHFKSVFPEASILIVSVGDKGIKINDDFVTDISIPYLVEYQKKIAQKTNSMFFNLFDSMGGNNSMIKWVEKGWAAKDFIHLSRSGAKKIANSIYNALIEEFRNLPK